MVKAGGILMEKKPTKPVAPKDIDAQCLKQAMDLMVKAMKHVFENFPQNPDHNNAYYKDVVPRIGAQRFSECVAKSGR